MAMTLSSQSKRLAIYVIFDQDGMIDDYIPFMLNALKEHISRLDVVVNGPLLQEGKEKLLAITEHVHIRENSGYDAGAWRDALVQLIGWEEVERYDEVLLLNDSFYGPFFSLGEVFQTMDQRQVDFWGMTSHGETEEWPEHIQSYFIAVRKKLVTTPDFHRYWEEMECFQSRMDAINGHEIVFTKHFADLGFFWGTYADTHDWEQTDGAIDFSLFSPYDLICDKRIPFLKRMAFSCPMRTKDDTRVLEQLMSTLQYLREHTDYDVMAMLKHVSRVCNYDALKAAYGCETVRKNAHIAQLLQSERELKGQVTSQATHIDQLLQSERGLKGQVTSQAAHIDQLLESERAFQGQVTSQAGHIDQLLQSERTLQGQVTSQSAHIDQLLQSERDLQHQLSVQRQESEATHKKLDEKVAELATLHQTLTDKETEIATLRQTVANKEGHIAQLLESDRELARIKSSRSWRFMGYAWKLRDILIPVGSKRRLVGKMLVKFVKHPIRFLKKCTPKRIGKFFKTLRREGTEGVSRRLDDCLIGAEIQAAPVEVQALPTETKTLADYAPLSVPQWDKPTVSIVIPVYNQFDYTYLCIRSILEHSGEVSYELIIADDCSTDLTVEIGKVITGLRVIRNKKNLRFLLNCNNAAKSARGKYILFLNNDTQVQEDWLAPLVELIEADESIGMVGSKLIYPDGRLQEAGGILWKDGSAWNFGNRSDPDASEFNYVKEVDYISGAAIMIRAELWRKIGGFDERFVPAYCEDSDLAFEVRAHGYKVVYQPRSVVVHFEGVSNGTDVTSGQKAYQVANQKKFFEKWQSVLEAEHYPNAEHVFRARERAQGKKVLLMVDHYVPQYDKDAGSRTVFQYIKLFVSQGYHVKFIGDNFFPHQPYTQVLQQMGVEVLYGPYYAQHWKEWLKENGGEIGYAFLNRPHIAVNYIDLVREYTPARIVYYGHDLHFLRERREYELTGEKDLLRSANEWQEKELALMRKADMAYYPSFVEEQEIHTIAPDVSVKAIPAYLFDRVEPQSYKAEERRDLMFIGGFGHRPNVDAVKWLAREIMPKLQALLPGVVVHILGSNPPQEVTDLATESLRIEGFVTDEELAEYYRSCRIAIVPLRYGAGIKGKVVEAMRYGIPVVTTSVGAEGILGVEDILAVADPPEGFAQTVAALYHDDGSLAARSAASYRYVAENFSPEGARQVIGPEFDM